MVDFFKNLQLLKMLQAKVRKLVVRTSLIAGPFKPELCISLFSPVSLGRIDAGKKGGASSFDLFWA